MEEKLTKCKSWQKPKSKKTANSSGGEASRLLWEGIDHPQEARKER